MLHPYSLLSFVSFFLGTCGIQITSILSHYLSRIIQFTPISRIITSLSVNHLLCYLNHKNPRLFSIWLLTIVWSLFVLCQFIFYRDTFWIFFIIFWKKKHYSFRCVLFFPAGNNIITFITVRLEHLKWKCKEFLANHEKFLEQATLWFFLCHIYWRGWIFLHMYHRNNTCVFKYFFLLIHISQKLWNISYLLIFLSQFHLWVFIKLNIVYSLGVLNLSISCNHFLTITIYFWQFKETMSIPCRVLYKV